MIVIFIPFSLIAILALVALVAGGAAVAAAVSFLAEHFLAVSLVLWAVAALIAWAVQQEKGIAGRLYVLSTTLTAAPVFAVFYEWIMEMNQFLAREAYFSMLMDAVGGVFALALAAAPTAGILFLGDRIKESGHKKLAILSNLVLTVLAFLLVLAVLHLEEIGDLLFGA